MVSKTSDMTDQDKRHDIVEERLRSWLEHDTEGIRHAIIRVLLIRSDLTIMEIYEHVSASFSTSYHSVAGMVGIISSRIGILSGTRDDQLKCRLYRLREKHIPAVRRVLPV
ncbi:MAG TPA: DUF2551 domain-containing protein [Methanospirillum sp.]|nr:DUF2551 domain-containing protein [Methanospirillum sp.]